MHISAFDSILVSYNCSYMCIFKLNSMELTTSCVFKLIVLHFDNQSFLNKHKQIQFSTNHWSQNMVGFPAFQNNNNNQQSMIFCSAQILLLHTVHIFLKFQLSFKRAIFFHKPQKKTNKNCKLLFAYIIIKHKQRYYSVTNESITVFFL